MERILKSRNPSQQERSPVKTLIITPTRELAGQIAVEVQKLAMRIPSLDVVITVGGTPKDTETRNLKRLRPEIVVATPGRLVDHLADPGTKELFFGVQTLVLDEADRLLDQGFKQDLEDIIYYLPKQRQTMLFSATFSPAIKDIAQKSLLPNYKLISTISPDDANTHEKIPQHLITLPDDDVSTILPVAAQLILNERKKAGNTFKAMIFLPTARHTGLYGALFEQEQFKNQLPQIFSIHSRMNQNARTKTSAGFSAATSALLFSSDVTARAFAFLDFITVDCELLTSHRWNGLSQCHTRLPNRHTHERRTIHPSSRPYWPSWKIRRGLHNPIPLRNINFQRLQRVEEPTHHKTSCAPSG